MKPSTAFVLAGVTLALAACNNPDQNRTTSTPRGVTSPTALTEPLVTRSAPAAPAERGPIPPNANAQAPGTNASVAFAQPRAARIGGAAEQGRPSRESGGAREGAGSGRRRRGHRRGGCCEEIRNGRRHAGIADSTDASTNNPRHGDAYVAGGIHRNAEGRPGQQPLEPGARKEQRTAVRRQRAVAIETASTPRRRELRIKKTPLCGAASRTPRLGARGRETVQLMLVAMCGIRRRTSNGCSIMAPSNVNTTNNTMLPKNRTCARHGGRDVRIHDAEHAARNGKEKKHEPPFQHRALAGPHARHRR